MREERGRISGDLVIHEPYELWGAVGGNVTVVEGGKLYVRGAIYGNLTVEFGGRVHIFGNVTGALTVRRGAKVIISGVLGGDAVNLGGRIFIDNAANVLGRIKTHKGETVVEPRARPIPRRQRE